MRVRVAVHVHSEWSYDGHWSLARIAAAFRRRRYDAVLVCEHDRGFTPARQAEHREACRRHSDGILLVPGIEYSDPDNVVHVPVWGDVPFLGEGRDTGGLLADVSRLDGMALLAHPSRHDALSVVRPEWLAALSGVELWSRKYDGWRPNPLLAGDGVGGLPAFASLDFHRRRQLAPLGMVVDLPGTLSEHELLAAFRARQARAYALGLPIERFVDGWPATAMRGADAVRRPAARLVRAIRP